jgi:hypothetical protein
MTRSLGIVNCIPIIRLCKDCIHYSEDDDTCKVLSILNYKHQDVSRIKSLYCRTREDLCGMNAKYYEPRQVTVERSRSHLISQNGIPEDDIVTGDYKITYYIDGSSGLTASNIEVDTYYDSLHTDFNDVY